MKKRAFTKTKILALIIILLIAAAVYFLAKPKKIRNVLLITLDTTRADHLSCYGFSKNTTPNIDAIAKEGMLFENAASPIALTLPAHSSMLTGTYPPRHKVHDNINFTLDPSNLTLPEILKQKGFNTAAVISAFVLYPQFGINQGFDSYNSKFINPIMAGKNKDTERRGDETAQFANEFIQQNKDKPFFLFAHFYDPHLDYNPPEPFASKYRDDLYSGEIAYTDYCVGKIIEKLKKEGLYDSTLIIIAGDHGEGLGDHGETEHSYFIYQSTIKVPLIIKPPGLKQPIRIKDAVSIVDILPTVLGYLKIDIPEQVQGKDLSIYQKDKKHTDKKRNVYIESLVPTKYTKCNSLLGLVGSRYKYIKTTRPELYDIINDAEEKNNLFEKEKNRARVMEGQLLDFIESTVTTTEIRGNFELDEESRKQLESLGYIGGEMATDSFDFDETKADPKDFIDYFDQAQKVVYLRYKGKIDEAKKLSYEMIDQWPELPYTYFVLTQIVYSQKQYKETIKIGEKYIDMVKDDIDLSQEAVGINPAKGYAMVHHRVAQAAYAIEDFDSAIKHWSMALKAKEDWPEVLYALGGAFFQKGDNDKAIELWEKALKLNPDWPEARENLDKLLKQKEIDATVIQYLEMVKQNPDDIDTHAELAGFFHRNGESEKAIEHWNQIIAIKPDSVKTHNNLAATYHKQKNFPLAVKHWEKVIELEPKRAEVYNNLAWIFATEKNEKIYNPKKAIQFAKQACELTDYKQPGILDTLSVAYAADGKFEEAVKTAKKALELALQTNQEQTAQEIRNHLKLYHAKKPYNK